MVIHARTRRGWALVDVIVGGVILAVGLAAVVSIAQRALAMQQRAEREVVAAALIDGLLNEVLATGVVEWQLTKLPDGSFEAPFEDWNWTVEIKAQAQGDPHRVVATVRDPVGAEHRVETLITPRPDNLPDPVRTPGTPIDRQARYDALQQQ
jgi:type II secretory pathway pseudopilin PulG